MNEDSNRRWGAEPGDKLVLRWVEKYHSGVWHCCPALAAFPNGAIVTLEALCGEWVLGELTWRDSTLMLQDNPVSDLCVRCLELRLKSAYCMLLLNRQARVLVAEASGIVWPAEAREAAKD